MDSALKIETALRAGQVAKSALEFTEPTQTGLLLKLRFKQLIDDVNGLREAANKAAAEDTMETAKTAGNTASKKAG